MWGLGKRRSKVGKLIDEHGYTQEDLRQASGISRNTVSKICNDPNYIPSPTVMKKLMKALRKLKPDAKASDFFDI